MVEETRADDLSDDDDLPLPGTLEDDDADPRPDPTEGPGNVTVDEPTESDASEP